MLKRALTVAATGAVAVATLAMGAPAAQAASPYAADQAVGAFVDMTLWPTPTLSTIASSTNTNYITPSFMNGDTSAGCTPAWGGYSAYAVGGGQDFQSDIAAAQAAGVTVAIAFGGANGGELADTCSNQASLVAAYEQVINRYNVTILNFDIEGADVGNRTTDQARAAAIKQVQTDMAAQGKTISVILTLPTTTSGLDAYGQATVQDWVNAGVPISAVNLMAMDYLSTQTGDMSQYAISAAQGTASFLQTLAPWSSMTQAQALAYVGLTPMIGQNDTAGEIFTLQDAAQTAQYVAQNNLPFLGWWEGTRDVACTTAGQPLYECSGVTQNPYEFGMTFAAGTVQ